MTNAEPLIEQLLQATDWPEPELLHAIVAAGDAVIDPLLEVLRAADTGKYPWGCISVVPYLLATLQTKSAIPILSDLLAPHDSSVTLNQLAYTAQALAEFGVDGLAPLLAIVANKSAEIGSRDLAIRAAVRLAATHPEVWEQTLAALIATFSDLIARASTLTNDEISLGAAFLYALSPLNDPTVEEVVFQAESRAGIPIWSIICFDDMAGMIGEYGREFYEQPQPWLQRYTERYPMRGESYSMYWWDSE